MPPSATPAAHGNVPTIVDMRSDTVTKPTPSMRAAMLNAEVGDDVFADDPTVLRLQQQVADLLGKEAGLFVPSGTMGNLICTLVHVSARGGEMIVGDQSHIHYYEQGNSAQFGGIHSRVLKNKEDGTFEWAELEAAVRPLDASDDHQPLTQLICIENTHNRMGGRILPVSYMDALGDFAHSRGLKLHVDGARLLNASTALGVEPARLVSAADTVSLCLSKGLGAPIGSVIVGSRDFIRQARRTRKALGGGMRQVGLMAAAALVALEEVRPQLGEDHRRAKQLAEACRKMEGVSVPTEEEVHTNIVYASIDPSVLSCSASQLTAALREQGVWLSATGPLTVRFVTHHQVDEEGVQKTIQAMEKVMHTFRNKQ